MEFKTDVPRLREDFEKVLAILAKTPRIDPGRRIGAAEFRRRAERVYAALAGQGIEVGLVFSDEHYCGDVPYLGGNTNITVEQVAGVVGRTGFHLIAGLEGGYVAEQLARRAGVKVVTYGREQSGRACGCHSDTSREHAKRREGAARRE